MSDIFDSISNFCEEMNKLRVIKQRNITKRRIKAQNNPLTKARKSVSMKAYWERKKQKDIDEKEGEILAHEYAQEHCICHLGNPPCSFCVDSNYCEECRIQTIEDYCPKCGEILNE